MAVTVVHAKILTVSDGVAAGERDDKSGAALVDALGAAGFDVVDHRVVADGVKSVGEALIEMSEGFAGLIVTTGGTGFGPRDLTPEATRDVIHRDAPGLGEAMRRAGDAGGRGFGMLSRGVCGTRGRALICNLPGSTGGALECLEAIGPAVPHVLELLSGGQPH